MIWIDPLAPVKLAPDVDVTIVPAVFAVPIAAPVQNVTEVPGTASIGHSDPGAHALFVVEETLS